MDKVTGIFAAYRNLSHTDRTFLKKVPLAISKIKSLVVKSAGPWTNVEKLWSTSEHLEKLFLASLSLITMYEWPLRVFVKKALNGELDKHLKEYGKEDAPDYYE